MSELAADELQELRQGARLEAQRLRVVLEEMMKEFPDGTAVELLLAYARGRYMPQPAQTPPSTMRSLDELMREMTRQLKPDDE